MGRAEGKVRVKLVLIEVGGTTVNVPEPVPGATRKPALPNVVKPEKDAELPKTAPTVVTPSVVEPVDVRPALKLADVPVIAPIVVAPRLVVPVDVSPALKLADVPVMAPIVVAPRVVFPEDVNPPRNVPRSV